MSIIAILAKKFRKTFVIIWFGEIYVQSKVKNQKESGGTKYFISKIEFGGQIMLIEEKLTKQELFTTTEKRIADYIRRNIEATVYMTIEELAKATQHSDSAIIRLCKKMGFSGFKEFRFELGRSFINRLPSLIKRLILNFPF